MRTLLVVALIAGGSSAWAQGGAEDHAKADAVFEEAQKLKQAGKTDEACAKYDEALKYNRNAVGTLLNVGKCNEDAGRFATAIKHYTQARDLAREHNLNEHRTAAEERITATSPRVPRLAIAFTERADDMKLVIDDIVYPSDAETTSELRLDPGKRHVVVTAPGRVPFDTHVELVEGKLAALAVPKLGYPVTVKRGRRTVGIVLSGLGIGLVGTSIVLGYRANTLFEDQIKMGRCTEVEGDTPLCDAQGYAAANKAKDRANIATIVGVAGVAVLGAGVFLWLTAPKESASGVAVVPTVTTESAGLAAIGRF